MKDYGKAPLALVWLMRFILALNVAMVGVNAYRGSWLVLISLGAVAFMLAHPTPRRLIFTGRFWPEGSR